ncbi:MAG: hypothetical protein D6682_02195 [Zetaproteobacteria bacterium]|nr:MAG: hypothetical protein D6682_02195 [Zetaproteobacteria bacterium]
MVKKALNNPLVVGVLVLLALAFVLRDALHFSSLFGGSRPARRQAPPLVLTPPKSAAAPARAAAPSKGKPAAGNRAHPRLEHTDWARVAAAPLTGRDPFAPAPHGMRPVPRSAATDDAAEMAIPDLRLQAIVSTQGRYYASINGRVLTVGERMQGWKLVAVGEHRVQMRGPGGLLTLDIDGGARLGGRPIRHVAAAAAAPAGLAKKGAVAAHQRIPQDVGELHMDQDLLRRPVRQGVIPAAAQGVGE